MVDVFICVTCTLQRGYWLDLPSPSSDLIKDCSKFPLPVFLLNTFTLVSVLCDVVLNIIVSNGPFVGFTQEFLGFPILEQYLKLYEVLSIVVEMRGFGRSIKKISNSIKSVTSVAAT